MYQIRHQARDGSFRIIRTTVTVPVPVLLPRLFSNGNADGNGGPVAPVVQSNRPPRDHLRQATITRAESRKSVTPENIGSC